jgi:UDP-glucose 4-epimerase
MEKILITGLSGFIGSYLNARLSPSYEIHDLGCDLLDEAAIKARLEDVQPHFVIHLAARTEVEKSFYEQSTFSSVNYVGTVNMIEASKNLKNLKLFVFSSTMETYGWQPESDMIKHGTIPSPLPAFDENTPQNPNAPYAVAKVACESYLQYASRVFGIPYCILRQTNTYGRVDNDFFVVERIIAQMLENKEEISLGYKEPYRNFLFVDDLIDLYETVVSNPDLAKNQIFCTGPNNAISISSLVELISKKIGWDGNVRWNTRPHRHGEIYILNSTNEKARSVLGWSPKTSLDLGLDKTISIWKLKKEQQ